MKFISQKLEGWATVQWKLHNCNFNHFYWSTHVPDGRTDWRTISSSVCKKR